MPVAAQDEVHLRKAPDEVQSEIACVFTNSPGVCCLRPLCKYVTTPFGPGCVSKAIPGEAEDLCFCLDLIEPSDCCQEENDEKCNWNSNTGRCVPHQDGAPDSCDCLGYTPEDCCDEDLFEKCDYDSAAGCFPHKNGAPNECWYDDCDGPSTEADCCEFPFCKWIKGDNGQQSWGWCQSASDGDQQDCPEPDL